MLREFFKLRPFKEKEIIELMPCDMSTHNSMTKAEHMTCFRCQEHHDYLREMFEVINGTFTLKEVAKDRNCFVSDLLVINSGESVSFGKIIEGHARKCNFEIKIIIKETVLQELTKDKAAVPALANDTTADQVLRGPLRVYKSYPMQNHRPPGCTAEDIKDLQLPFCETHGIMRVSETLTNSMLSVIFMLGTYALGII